MPIIVTPVYGSSAASNVLSKAAAIYETSARASNLNILIPTERLAGDLIVVFTMTYATVNTPAGWTLATSNSQGNTIINVFTKVSAGNETSLNLTMGNADMHTAVCMVFSSNAVYSKAAYFTGGSGPISSVPVPAVSAVPAGSYIVGLLHGYGSASSGGFTWPAGITEFADRWSTTDDTFGNYNHTGFAAKFQVAEGAHGPWSVTATEAAYYTAATVVFAPNLQ